MKFTLSEPCGNMCPFRIDCLKGWLGEKRATEIIDALTREDKTFACHKTVEYDDDDELVLNNPKEQHCAGAMILLEKNGFANQMMRICERIGLYDRNKLNMDAKVFDEFDDFIEHHSKS